MPPFDRAVIVWLRPGQSVMSFSLQMTGS